MTEARRRALLYALAVAPGLRLPLAALRQQLELIGYVVSMDLLRTDAAWLAEQGLLRTDAAWLDEQVPAVALTERGADVAQGRAQVPGLARPQPGERPA